MIGSFKLSGVATMLNGQLQGGDAEFTRVSTDTRSLQAGDLFVALQGDRFDGNDYVAVAAERGACGALVSRFGVAGLPQLLVADTTRALGLLGAANRQRSAARVVAVTGSQGKTTVKEMTGRILGSAGSTLVTQGNLNNAIGVPLTLLRLVSDHRFAVVELGANGPGEIDWTAGLTRPDVVLITNAAGTHLEGFGSLAGVVSAKGELLDHVRPDGVALLNRDDPAFGTWQARVREVRVESFSVRNSAASYRAEQIETATPGCSSFLLRTPSGSCEIRLSLPGLHNVANAVAAAAAALEAGATLAQVQTALAAVRAVKGRMCVQRGPRGSVLIDDSYNASPSSFEAALRVLVTYPGNRILVAGDMAELGDTYEAAHRQVGHLARQLGVDTVLATGVASRWLVEGFGHGGRHFASVEETARACLDAIDGQTVVLVKGSRSAGMERIVDLLTNSEAT